MNGKGFIIKVFFSDAFLLFSLSFCLSFVYISLSSVSIFLVIIH